MQLEKQRKRKIQERQTTGIERGMREEEKGIERENAKKDERQDRMRQAKEEVREDRE